MNLHAAFFSKYSRRVLLCLGMNETFFKGSQAPFKLAGFSCQRKIKAYGIHYALCRVSVCLHISEHFVGLLNTVERAVYVKGVARWASVPQKFTVHKAVSRGVAEVTKK